MDVKSVLQKYNYNKRYLIAVLQDIQKEYNWLPQEMLIEVSKKLNIPLINIYEIATFYRSFSLKPRGKHIITVCLGTACHVRGGQRIVDEISRTFGIGPGETTSDKKFTLETVNCLGCCAIGPVVVIDNEYYGGMNPTKTIYLLKKYENQ